MHTSGSDLPGQLGAVLREMVRDEVRAALRDVAPRAADPSALLSVVQVAARLAMSASYVRAAIRDGRLASVKVGRSVRVRESDVDALPARQRQPRDESAAQRAERALGLGRAKRCAS